MVTIRGRGAVAAAAAGIVAAALLPATPASAADCFIGNGAGSVDIFGLFYVDHVSTGGTCYPEDEVSPYTCVVFGRALGGLAIPTDIAAASSQNPQENFCQATAYALSFERCQGWYVLGEYRVLANTIASESGYEYTCV